VIPLLGDVLTDFGIADSTCLHPEPCTLAAWECTWYPGKTDYHADNLVLLSHVRLGCLYGILRCGVHGTFARAYHDM
jgi:hypothetical protein